MKKRLLLPYVLAAALVMSGVATPVMTPMVVEAAEVTESDLEAGIDISDAQDGGTVLRLDKSSKIITITTDGAAVQLATSTKALLGTDTYAMNIVVKGTGTVTLSDIDYYPIASIDKWKVDKLTIKPESSASIIISSNVMSGKDLTSVTLQGVTAINDACFGDANKVATLNLGDSLETVGKNVFQSLGIDVSGGVALNIPSTLTTIGSGAFGISNLKSIDVQGSSAMTIGDSAFSCGKLMADNESYFNHALAITTSNDSFKHYLSQKHDIPLFGDKYTSMTLNGDPFVDNGSAKAKVTVSFDYGVESGITTDTVTVEKGKPVTAPAEKAWAGHTFSGWYTKAVGGTKWDFNTNVDSELTLYAHWDEGASGTEDQVTVTFKTNSSQTSDFTSKVTKGQKVTKPADPKKTDYTFKGWFTSADGAQEFDFNAAVEKDTTVFAQWTAGATDPEEPSGPITPVTPIGSSAYDVGAHEGEAIIYYNPTSKTATLFGMDQSDLEQNLLAPGNTKNGLASEFVNTLNTQRARGVEFTTQGSMNLARAATNTTLQNIGDGLFEGNTFFKTAIIDAPTLTYIGENAFNNSATLETVVISGNSAFDEIGAAAFADCPKLKSVTIDNVVRLADGVFENDASLSRVELTGVSEIGESAFAKSGLTSIALPDGITVIDANTFSGCANLTEVMIPSSVTEIKAGAFANTALTEIKGNLNSNLKVAASAFSTEQAELSITIPETAPKSLLNYSWSSNGYAGLNLGAAGTTSLVRFENNGHGVTIDPKSIKTGGTIDLSTDAYKLVANDFTFDGWYYDSALTKPATSSATSPITINGNTTFYAKWHKNYLTVTYDQQAGGVTSTETVAYNTTLKKPANPTNGDKKFSGWFLDATGNRPFNFNTAITEDTTLFAKWTDPDIFTVSFDVDGAETTIESQEVTEGQYASKPTEALKKTDYTFDDWYADPEYKTKFNFAKTKITGDTTIYAHWLSDQVVVTFNSNGGSQVTSQSVKRNQKGTAPANPTKENAEFLGWFKDEGLTQQFFFETNAVTDNMTLYAKWNQTAFTVKFVSNGGSAMEPVTTEPNSLIARPSDPVKEGYYLAAWCRDSGLTTPWNFDVDQVTGDMTLYAQWLPGTPEDNTYNDASGTGTKIPQTGDNNPFGWLWELFD